MQLIRYFIFIIGLFGLSSLTSCSDDEPTSPAFIENAGIQEENQTLSPGMNVHLTGSGYLESDNVMLDFFWESGDELFPVGYVVGYNASITSFSGTGITIKMPYRLPASRVEIYIIRGGEKMDIGKLYLTDGTTPKQLNLYGINNSKKIETSESNMITRWLDSDNEQCDIQQWNMGDHSDFHSTVGIYRAFGMCGLSKENGSRYPYFFDLCTQEWSKLSELSTIALFSTGSQIYAIQSKDDKYYGANSISSQLEISNYTTKTKAETSPMPAMRFPLPDKMNEEQFGEYPGAYTQNGILLSANKGNGVWTPVIFHPLNGFFAMEDIEASALIPFSLYGKKQSGNKRIFGYIVVKNGNEKGDKSLFYTLDENMKFSENPFITYPNQALSASANNDKPGTLTIHFKAYRSDNVTMEYSFDKQEMNGIEHFSSFDEIVWIN